VADHSATLLEIAEREIGVWPTNAPVALHPLIRSLTLRVIVKAIFGEQDCLDRLHTELLRTLDISPSLLLQEPNLRHLPGWRATWLAFIRARAAVDDLLRSLINRRRAERAGERSTGLLDSLLDGEQADGSPMTDVEIRDNLISMILAGHETTTGELAWAFQLLAHNQHVQDRLLEEIDSSDDDTYLTATVNETMRRRPVFLFIIPRKVVRSVDIGGWAYRPPAQLAGCTYLMHHNPDLFPRPFEFRPERFLEEPPDSRTWLPWGGGRKNCLGRHFALMEVKTILRRVLAVNRVLPVGSSLEPPRWRSAILVPGRGGRVVLRPRAAERG
jgi:hypothetical protein